MQTVSYNIDKYQSLTFTFSYHDMVLTYRIDEPYSYTKERIYGSVVRNGAIYIKVSEGMGKGNEVSLMIKLPNLFIPLFSTALDQAFQDPRVMEPSDDSST